MFGFAQPFPPLRERLFFHPSPRRPLRPLRALGQPSPAFLTYNFHLCYHEKELEGSGMSNRLFLILIGICLIGSLFFALKLLGTMLN